MLSSSAVAAGAGAAGAGDAVSADVVCRDSPWPQAARNNAIRTPSRLRTSRLPVACAAFPQPGEAEARQLAADSKEEAPCPRFCQLRVAVASDAAHGFAPQPRSLSGSGPVRSEGLIDGEHICMAARFVFGATQAPSARPSDASSRTVFMAQSLQQRRVF